MTKLILPCMSMEAHGKIGIGLIFATNQWGQYVKFVPKVRWVESPTRKKVNHAYGQIATEWRFMSATQRAAYHAQAIINRRTDYNQYFNERWPEVYEP